MAKKKVSMTDKEVLDAIVDGFKRLLDVGIRRNEQDSRDFAFSADSFKAKANTLKEVRDSFVSVVEAYTNGTKEVDEIVIVPVKGNIKSSEIKGAEVNG